MNDKQRQYQEALENGTERELAIAWHLDAYPDTVTETLWGDGKHFDADDGGEYMVLTDAEADEAVEEYITESLWVFNPEFLSCYIADGSLSAKDVSGIIGDRCEDANPTLLALVGDRMEELIRDAVAADGRGIFLAGYDFEEIEQEINGEMFYVYRTN